MSSGSGGDIYAATMAVFRDLEQPHEPLTTPEVTASLDCGRRAAHKRLSTLAERGTLQTKKVGSGARVWWQTPGNSAAAVERSTADPSSAGDDFPRSNGAARNFTDELGSDRDFTRFRGLIEDLGDPVYELDREGRFVYVNRAFEEWSGYDAAELLGESVSIGLDDQTRAELESRIHTLLHDDSIEAITHEYEAQIKTGEWRPVENHLTVLTDGNGRLLGSVGVMRDITERRRRERELSRVQDLLRNAERLGAIGAWEYDVTADELFWTEGTRQIHEVDSDYEPTTESGIQFYHPDDRDTIRELFTACVERGEPYRAELRLVTAAGALRWVHTTGEAITAGGGNRRIRGYIQDVTERKRRERELETHREHLAALNSLNEVFREITDAVVEQSTRAEIERVTCEQLVNSDSYTFAWIAEVDPSTEQIRPRVELGVDGFLESVSLSADPSDPTAQGPAGRAVQTGEIQVSTDVYNDPRFERWRPEIEQYDFRACAAIPIVYEDSLYGLIGVYSERTDAFAEAERAVIGQLGEVVGHAIAAVERKQALLSDEIVVMTLKLRDVIDRLGLDLDGRLSFDSTVPLGDGRFLVYCTATEEALAAVRTMAADESLPHWDSITLLQDHGSRTRFVARLVDPPLLSQVVEHGGHVEQATFEDRGLTVEVHLAASGDVQNIVDTITSTYPDVEMLSRHQRTRSTRPPGAVAHHLSNRLTDRQQAALEGAYFAGYFDTPRGSSGQDVADSLGISASTFHQHVRKAEKKVFEELFAEM